MQKIDKTGFHLKNLITNLNLDDIFRKKNPNLKIYTYHNNKFTSQSYIDYIFTPKYYLGNISDVIFKQVPKVPDHKAVIITINFDVSRGN